VRKRYWPAIAMGAAMAGLFAFEAVSMMLID
jgi:hypothetical protein